MKNIMKTILFVLCVCVAVFTVIGCSTQKNSVSDTVANDVVEPSVKKVYDISELPDATVFVIGDSTVCDYVKADGTHTDSTYFYPRYGYGTQFSNYLSSKITVKNLALSGRSAKSFLAEPNYQTFVNEIKEGDFLVIGFGHNDQKSDDAERFASANESISKEGSFKNLLWNKYAKIAKDKGATVILCSPIVRISKTEDYTGSYGHVTATGDYGKAVQELAEEKGLDFVNLRDITASIWSEATYDNAKYFHAITKGTSSDAGVTVTPDFNALDGTHINIYGAKRIAYEFAKTIAASDSALAPYVDNDKLIMPTKEADLEQNPDYKWVKYTVVDWANYEPASQFVTLTEGWYGTAFGDTGGSPAAEVNGYCATETSSGVFTVGQTGTSSPKGKIASTCGIAFSFKPVSITRNFTITAKAKVLTTAATKQTGFGLMLRDDCYEPVNDKSIISNYVAAGFVTSDSDANVNFSYAGSLKKSTETAGGLFKVGDTAEFTIKRLGQVVTVTTVYKGKTYTETFTDFDFVAMDTNYFYIGMFATRGTTVEFTDVKFTDDGESQGA